MRFAVIASIALIAMLLLLGCQASGGETGKPTVIVNSPPSGSSFSVGDDVQVQSTANDSKGVTRVELQVDGTIVRTDQSPVVQGQSQFSVIQTWKAASVGNHTIIVRAYNATGAYSDAGLALVVKESAAALLTETPTAVIATVVPPPTLLTLPTSTSTVSIATAVPLTNTPVPQACTNDSQYIADISIPDGTVIQAGSTFVKTWQVRNSGTCPWDASYTINFLGGTAFVVGAAPIPPAAPGAVVNISLTMTAPAAYGTFSGNWRLRAGNGSAFGTNLTTVINVPNPNPPSATPTNTSLPGAPQIASFTCSPCTITTGGSATLNYGKVTNATSASIDQGIGGISTPGSKTVSPTTTTTYTLKATGPGGTTQASVVVTVVGNFAGHWEHNFGYLDLTQSGANVTGTFHNSSDVADGTIAGTITGNTLNGTWQRSISGTLQFTLSGTGDSFTGNWNTTNQWCGARTGIAFPSGCAYDGHWTTWYDPAPGTMCSMDLSQVGSTVTGTYCNGTITNGTITYDGGYVKLSGTWKFGSVNSGPFIFYLPVYTFQGFIGNYNGSLDWCGLRSGSRPSTCEKN